MLEKPAALDTLFTIGNVPPADICIQRGSEEAQKKKENEEKKRDRNWTWMPMFPFFCLKSQRDAGVKWLHSLPDVL